MFYSATNHWTEKYMYTSVLQSKIFAGFFSVLAESWKNLKDTTAFSSFPVC